MQMWVRQAKRLTLTVSWKMANKSYHGQKLAKKRFRDTAAGGPEWKSVVRRTTYDAVTGSLIDDVAYPARLPASRVFAKLPGGQRKMIRTVFLYSPFPDIVVENVDETLTVREMPKAPPDLKWKVILL